MNFSDINKIIPPKRGEPLSNNLGYPTLRYINFLELTGVEINKSSDDIRTALDAISSLIYPTIQQLNAISLETDKKIKDIDNLIANNSGSIGSINSDLFTKFKEIKDIENKLGEISVLLAVLFSKISDIENENNDLKNIIAHNLSINSNLTAFVANI